MASGLATAERGGEVTMSTRRQVLRVIVTGVAMAAAGLAALPSQAAPPGTEAEVSLLASGLAGGSGSTVGPDGALYVPEHLAGRIARIDPVTGATETFARGLPPALVGIGGAVDVAFLGGTAYVLVTMVGADLGGDDVVGIYRVDGPDDFTVVADLGAFSEANPPETDFFVPTGVQYAMQLFRGGFLVTDGHHNRVLWAGRDGTVRELIAFGNIVPTGLEVHGSTVLIAEAGPLPHNPADGRVVSFSPGDASAAVVASGAPLLVDVERGRGRTLYALSQGIWTGGIEGSPASPDSGALVSVRDDGSFAVVVGGIDRPTSMEVVGTTAYVVTIDGEVWRVDGVSGPPYGG